MSGSVKIERDTRGVVTLWLNNPSHRNALNDGIISALTEAFRQAADDAACKVVVMRGRLS